MTKLEKVLGKAGTILSSGRFVAYDGFKLKAARTRFRDLAVRISDELIDGRQNSSTEVTSPLKGVVVIKDQSEKSYRCY